MADNYFAGNAVAAPIDLILRPHAVQMSVSARKGAHCGKRTSVIVLPIALTCTASPDLMLQVEVGELIWLATLSSYSMQFWELVSYVKPMQP